VDLGDRSSRYCILDEAGEVVRADNVPTTKTGWDTIAWVTSGKRRSYVEFLIMLSQGPRGAGEYTLMLFGE
jgi:hypothetical protein